MDGPNASLASRLVETGRRLERTPHAATDADSYGDCLMVAMAPFLLKKLRYDLEG